MSLIDNIQSFNAHHLRRLFLLLFLIGGSGGNKVHSETDDIIIVIRKYLALPQSNLKLIVSLQNFEREICSLCFITYLIVKFERESSDQSALRQLLLSGMHHIQRKL